MSFFCSQPAIMRWTTLQAVNIYDNVKDYATYNKHWRFDRLYFPIYDILCCIKDVCYFYIYCKIGKILN